MIRVAVIAPLLGAAVGGGLGLALAGLVPNMPDLGSSLRRVHAPTIAGDPPSAGRTRAGRWLTRWGGAWLRPPTEQLLLIGSTPERFALEKVGLALLGLVFPPVLTMVLALLGLRLGVVLPAAAALGLSATLFVLVDVSVRQRAAAARREFVRAVAVYLDLVALERSASHGPVESLERAARVGEGWVFERIRDALEAARSANLPPWDCLAQVAETIGVPELGDVGDIMRLSGNEGAQVYQTLISRAQSLRVTLRAGETDRANTDTTWLYVPVSLTVAVLFVLAGYPALIRLMTT